MPSTPPRSARKEGGENRAPPVSPWSLSKVKRFEGHGSYYVRPCGAFDGVDADSKPAAMRKTPLKERYLTPAERALERVETPNKEAPSASYLSSIDRFGAATPGSVYTVPEAPGVGTYTPSEQARVRGAVKLQKAIRRRQSRGIFAQVRPDSVTPAPGDYTPSIPEGAAASSFAATHVDRFGVSEPGSMYSVPVGPGVGRFHPDDSKLSQPADSGRPSSAAYTSTTDRFGAAMPGSVYAASAAPGVGTYTPSERAKVRGAVKLQKAIRRRQSRGIFAQVRPDSVTPAPGDYAPPTPTPAEDGMASRYRPGDAMRPPRIAVRHAAPAAAKEEAKEHAEARANGAISSAALPKPRAKVEPQAKVEPVAMAKVEEEAVEDAMEAAKEAAKEEVIEGAKEETVENEVRASLSPTLDGRLSNISEIAATFRAAVIPPSRYSKGGTNLDGYEGARRRDCPASPISPRADKPPVTDATPSLSPQPLSEFGMEAAKPIASAPAEEVTPSVEADAGMAAGPGEEGEEAEGDWLFSQLTRICNAGTVAKEDYHSEEDGWDLAGLRSDLQLYMGLEGGLV